MQTGLSTSMSRLAMRPDAAVRMRNEDGQALIEYALILGLIAAVAVATLQLLGPGVVSLLSEVQASFP